MDINPIPIQLSTGLWMLWCLNFRGMGSMHWTEFLIERRHMWKKWEKIFKQFLELNRDPQNRKDETSNILNFFKQFLELNHNFWIEILKMSAPTGRQLFLGLSHTTWEVGRNFSCSPSISPVVFGHTWVTPIPKQKKITSGFPSSRFFSIGSTIW